MPESFHPLSHAGRVFNSFLILFGVTTIFIAIGAVTQTVIELEFGDVFAYRRPEQTPPIRSIEKKIASLSLRLRTRGPRRQPNELTTRGRALCRGGFQPGARRARHARPDSSPWLRGRNMRRRDAFTRWA